MTGMKVDSPLGERALDREGAPIGAVRLDPARSYSQVPALLQRFINDSDAAAWEEIQERIDYTFACLKLALGFLEEKTGFGAKVQEQVRGGKKLLFKPNLVNPNCIDPLTHGEGIGNLACTPWAFIAALMRWFHDHLKISYHEMTVGEAATGMSTTARAGTLISGQEVTTTAVMEGKCGDLYLGWGFYFARKYLAATHPPGHADDPMGGYEESIAGTYLPPGRAGHRLMVYDLNRLFDLPAKRREVPVPQGAVFKEITLHKAIVGGDPARAQDRQEYPGCVLVNVPKLKVHTQALLTNAVKNLGIGLYPMEAAASIDPSDTRWKYSAPFKPGPGLKAGLPHGGLLAKLDEKTGLPLRDENGRYLVEKTAGLSGVMVDIVKAVLNQGIFALHVADAVETANLRHDSSLEGLKVVEGYLFASLDPVALDLLGARYLFKTVPVSAARELRRRENLPADFIQRVPLPVVEGKDLVTRDGFDAPVSREGLFRYAEERGLGGRNYYVIGQEEATGSPLATLEGHLGRITGRRFSELLTSTLYYCAPKILWDLQATVLHYARANDQLTGSQFEKFFLDAFDENGDGVIDVQETGRRGFWSPFMGLLADAIHSRGDGSYGYMRSIFQAGAGTLRYSNPRWNAEGHDFVRELFLVRVCAAALRMSQATHESADPFFPGRTWGRGKWPSIQFAEYVFPAILSYGAEFPRKVSLLSLYGQAFQFADKKWNGGAYTGGVAPRSGPDSADDYLKAVAAGAPPLAFTLFVPRGYGRLPNFTPANVEETEDPRKVFTARFKDGDVW